MKKNYIVPETMVLNIKLERIMTGSGPSVYDTPAGEGSQGLAKESLWDDDEVEYGF